MHNQPVHFTAIQKVILLTAYVLAHLNERHDPLFFSAARAETLARQKTIRFLRHQHGFTEARLFHCLVGLNQECNFCDLASHDLREEI